MKQDTESNLIATIGVIILIGLFIGGIYFVNKTNQEKDYCLEPYALKICQERNLSYSSHSSSGIWCKEDIRDFDNLRFKFNRTEKISCGIGGVGLE